MNREKGPGREHRQDPFLFGCSATIAGGTTNFFQRMRQHRQNHRKVFLYGFKTSRKVDNKTVPSNAYLAAG